MFAGRGDHLEMRDVNMAALTGLSMVSTTVVAFDFYE